MAQLCLYGNCVIFEDIAKDYPKGYKTKKTSLWLIRDEIFKKDNIRQIHDIVNQWFALQLDIIIKSNILLTNTDTTNIYYDVDNNVLHFIDCSNCKHIRLIDRVKTSKEDFTYKFDPMDTDYKILKNDKPIDDIKEITDKDARNIFIHSIKQFNESINGSKLHEIIKQVLGINECVEMYISIMETLKFDHKIINLFHDYIIDYRSCTNVNQSLRNWLGGPFGNIASSHRVLSYMTVYPEEYEKDYKELADKNNPIHKMTRNEFRNWLLETRKQYPVTYRQIANMLYLHTEPLTELVNMKNWIQKNENIINELYRAETTDRFTDETLTVGKSISWENILSSTINKDYAISFFGNARGSGFIPMPGENVKNILFTFKNIKAALLHDDYSNETTYFFNYNVSNPEDNDRFNKFHTNQLIISNEYIILPTEPYTITKITTEIINASVVYFVELTQQYIHE